MNTDNDWEPPVIDDTVKFNKILSHLPQLLRGFGAAVLIIAMSIFMLQGWESGNDITRYLLLLTHTVGLAIIGFLSGHFIRESKGARLFLVLALVSVPANFAILGGFMYSQFAWDMLEVVYPGIVTWQVSEPISALVVSAAAVLIMLPVIFLGFMVLSRRSAKSFTVLFLLTNSVLLLPIRDTNMLSWLALGIVIVVMYINNKTRNIDPGLLTKDGLIVRMLQFAPVIVILARGLWLYSTGTFMFTTISILIFIGLRHACLLINSDNRYRHFMEKISLFPAIATAYGFANLADEAMPSLTGIYIPVFTVITAGLILELSLRSATLGGWYRLIACFIISTGMLLNLWLTGSFAMAIMCMMTGIAIAIYGYMNKQSLVLVSGMLTILVGLIFQIVSVTKYFDLGGWGSLAILGIVAILCGSIIERHGNVIKNRAFTWGRQIRDWQY